MISCKSIASLASSVFLGLFLAVVSVCVSPMDVGAFEVRKIELQGNKRIDLKTIERTSKIKVGDNLQVEDLPKLLGSVYGSNFFSSVSIEYDTRAGLIRIVVKEAPLVKALKFNGLKKFDAKLMREDLSTKAYSFYSKESLINDAKRLESSYRQSGLSSAKVRPMIELPENNNDNLVAILDIYEGVQAKINQTTFIGNENISSSKLSSILLRLREESMERKASSAFSEYKIDAAIKNVVEYYQDQSYANVSVVTASPILAGSSSINLTFFIKEGARYSFDEPVIVNRSSFFKLDDAREARKIFFKKGDPFSMRKIKEVERKITAQLRSEGFLLSEVSYNVELDKKSLTSKVIFNISDAKRVYVNKINFVGNVLTQNSVLLRQIFIRPGDPYNSDLIQSSVKMLYNTGYFKKVDVREKSESDREDLVDITFVLEEQSTARINASVGYQIGGSFLVSASYANDNMLGKGYSLAVSGEKSIYTTGANIFFSAPWTFNRNVRFGLATGFSTMNNEEVSNYKIFSYYLSPSFTFALTRNLSQTMSYSFRRDRLSLFANDKADAFIADQLGDFLTSSTTNTLFYDRRDNGIFPTKGYSITLSTSFAGLGGDIKYVSNVVSYNVYKQFWREDSVFAIKSRAGYIAGWGGQDVNPKDRFYLGASYGLRGFDFRSAGPGIGVLDSAGEVDGYDPMSYGGKFLFLTSFEYFFPNFLPERYGVRTFLFFDAGLVRTVDNPSQILTSPSGRQGKVVDSRLIRTAMGFGVNWDSPFGNMGISVGFPMTYEPWDNKRTIMFQLGGITI